MKQSFFYRTYCCAGQDSQNNLTCITFWFIDNFRNCWRGGDEKGKYGHLTLPVVFSDKVIPDNDFTGKGVVSICFSSKNTFEVDVSIQIITNESLCHYLTEGFWN